MNLLPKDTIEEIKKKALPVIIFGSRSVAEALFYACQEVGIKVDCFCDNNINRTKNPVCGLKVIYTPYLRNKYKDAIFLISAADIKDAVEQLYNLGFSKWYPSNLLLKNFNVYKYPLSYPADFVKYTIETCILCHENFLNSDKVFLRSVDIIVTERCSLKCKDCSNLIQYYKNPKDCDTKEILKSIDAFCNIIDEVNEFRIPNGEAFMNKEVHLIIKRLIDEPKVYRIVIYTNGTILPSKEQIEYLKDKKILFIITDYGKLSTKIDTLTRKLADNNIAFYVQKAQGWTDCAKIGRHYRSIKEAKEIFKNCCAKNTFTISDGKLYRCPFSANAFRLKAVPDYKDDYINFIKEIEDNKAISEIKEKIKKFILEKEFLQTCDFCNGRSFSDPEITPAIQIKKPLDYIPYV
jgi:hypothetical protein